jgi:hypothetical protein
MPPDTNEPLRVKDEDGVCDKQMLFVEAVVNGPTVVVTGRILLTLLPSQCFIGH